MNTTRARLAAFVLVLLLWLPVSGSYATTSIALPVKPIRRVCGIVRDLTGDPIPNAKVTVLKGEAEVVVVQAGEDGKFSCGRLEAGNYNVRVQADGFNTARSSVVIVKPTAKCVEGLEVRLSVGMGCSGMIRAKR
jgi:Carboxypeptidase regulatory-like domain